MYTPLNPYERFEITGMTDEEREEERCQQQEDRWYDYEAEDLVNELEAILDDAV